MNMECLNKTAYLYWNNSPMSWLQVQSVISFHNLNRDWKIIVYKKNTSDIGINKWTPDYCGKDYFHLIQQLDYVKVKKLNLIEFGIPADLHGIQACDIFRNEILFKNGGLYFDFDVLWLKPIEYLKTVVTLGNKSHFDCTLCFSKLTKGYHSIGIVYANKGSLILKRIIERQKELHPPYEVDDPKLLNNHQIFGAYQFNTEYPNYSAVVQNGFKPLVFPFETFYPYSSYQMDYLFRFNDLSFIHKNTVCVHWYNGHEFAKEFVNKENYDRVCSMNTILKQMKSNGII